MKVSFRIRRQYFAKIVSGEKTEEIRSLTPFWAKRLLDRKPEIAVFVCGKQVHRRQITGIYTEFPEKVLGRPLSLQGLADVKAGKAIIVKLGQELACLTAQGEKA